MPDTEKQKETAVDEAAIAAAKKLEDENKALSAARERDRVRLAAFAEKNVDEFLATAEALDIIPLKDLKSGLVRATLLSLAMRDAVGDSAPVKVQGADGKTLEMSEYEAVKALLRGLPKKLSSAETTETAIGTDAGDLDGELPANVERYNFGAHGGRKFAKSEFHEQVLAHMAAEEKAGRKVSYRQAYEAIARNNSRKSG